MLARECDGALRFGEVAAGDHELVAAGGDRAGEDRGDVGWVDALVVVDAAVHCVSQVNGDLARRGGLARRRGAVCGTGERGDRPTSMYLKSFLEEDGPVAGRLSEGASCSWSVPLLCEGWSSRVDMVEVGTKTDGRECGVHGQSGRGRATYRQKGLYTVSERRAIFLTWETLATESIHGVECFFRSVEAASTFSRWLVSMPGARCEMGGFFW